MASLAQQFTGIRCPPLSTSRLVTKNGGAAPPPLLSASTSKPKRKASFIVAAVAVSNAETKERQQLKKLFEEAYERCRTAPMEGVSFTMEEFNAGLDKYDFNSEIGTKVGSFLFFLVEIEMGMSLNDEFYVNYCLICSHVVFFFFFGGRQPKFENFFFIN